jgi:hypothetical protein
VKYQSHVFDVTVARLKNNEKPVIPPMPASAIPTEAQLRERGVLREGQSMSAIDRRSLFFAAESEWEQAHLKAGYRR